MNSGGFSDHFSFLQTSLAPSRRPYGRWLVPGTMWLWWGRRWRQEAVTVPGSVLLGPVWELGLVWVPFRWTGSSTQTVQNMH